ncbi:MAG: phosphatase family protein [Mucilaginibacter sp.]|nr:phosphatase family protein [Mucilaginibacter sp.]
MKTQTTPNDSRNVLTGGDNFNIKRHSCFIFSGRAIFFTLFYFALLTSFISCKKEGFITSSSTPSDLKNAHTYSSEIIRKWTAMQIRLMRDATGIPNVAFTRYYAYSGIAALEALTPGLPKSEALSGKWNGLTGLPLADKSKFYYWPASVNTALATINRDIFTAASSADKAAIDSLEAALNNMFLSNNNTEVITRSNAFGQSVAVAVFNWSETDGYKSASSAYTPPAGPGLWVPTPAAFGNASTPYWGNIRPTVEGSIINTQPGAPISYSDDPSSPFFHMAKQVYDASQSLTQDQINMALFWRDIPGVTAAGHWLSILQQVLQQTNASIAKAALAYAVSGVCLSDACISCWQTKYHYNMVRPITYIRGVMGFTTWNSTLATPAHPEYSSAHAVLSSAAANAFTAIFGNISSFTDHTYDYMSFTPRTFSSFKAIGEDAGNSRLYAGIHYQPSIDTGLIQGRKVAANILKKLDLH